LTIYQKVIVSTENVDFVEIIIKFYLKSDMDHNLMRTFKISHTQYYDILI